MSIDISSLLNQINDLNDSINKIKIILINHLNNTSLHYDSELVESFTKGLSIIEEIDKIITNNSSVVDPFSEQEINAIKYLSKHKDDIMCSLNQGNIALNYIVKNNFDNSLLPDNNVSQISDNDDNKVLEIVYRNELPEKSITDEPSYSLIKAYRIDQNDSHRFVTNEQIELWNNTVEALNNLIYRINYSEDTNIINIRNLPIADSNTNGLMSSDQVKSIKDIQNKVSTPDWGISNENEAGYIKNKPISLPANGGNADTIDGMSSKDIKNRNKMGISIGYSSNGNYDYNVENMSLKNIFGDIRGRYINKQIKDYIDIASDVYYVDSYPVEMTSCHIDGHESSLSLINNGTIILYNCVLNSINIESYNKIFNKSNSVILLDNNTVTNCVFDIDVNIVGSNNTLISNTFNGDLSLKANEDETVSDPIKYNIITSSRIEKLILDSGKNKATVSDNKISNNIIKYILISGSDTNYNLIDGNTMIKSDENDFNIILKSGFRNSISNNMRANIIYSDINVASTNNMAPNQFSKLDYISKDTLNEYIEKLTLKE